MSIGTFESAKGLRCLRCGTLIRNGRQRCPSCDLDFTASASSEASGASAPSTGAASPAAKAKPRAPKVGVKLCPMCMNSVSENEMTEANGQTICGSCANSLKNKAAKAPPKADGENK